MGLLIDTNVIIGFERKRVTSSDMLRSLRAAYAGVDLVLSAVSAVELAHGVARAKTDAIRATRRDFLRSVYESFDVIGVSTEIADRAGIIEGELAMRGMVVELADLLIGVTALHLSYAVLTHNMRHFEMIPGLKVVAPKFTL